ncbi:hypothetical protein H2248_000946 [Termitomyces sp. 'cryptogamus']|nr:hypothetical protein H2248_000946 [Termitomyces sp. 'cryptogamus']
MLRDSTDPISETARRSSSRITTIRSTGPLLPLGGAFSSLKPGKNVLFRPKPRPSSRDRSHPNDHKAIPKKAIKVTFQWVKGELLGKGSYAKVYLGLNATTGEIMAVKQVELPQTPSDKLNSRNREISDALKFERETLMRLDHPNIVQYLGYDESPTYLSIFLEYVPGGTISSCLVTRGVFSTEVTQSFTRQILQGLDYLHGMGIIHRDLKSDNILVEQTGVCKISDFGISKQVQDIAQARAYTEMRGTIYWMAPEVLDNDKQGYDLKVDIWSIGCIVLEMWTGQRPWSGEEIFPVMIKLSQEKCAPPIPDELVLSDDARDFRKQCFQRNPQDRPSAAELLGHQYLMLPPNWKFDLFELPLKRSSSQTSRRSKKSFKPPTRSEVTAVPKIAGDSTYQPVGFSPTLHAGPRQPYNPRQRLGDGPQVVIITPSSSRPPQIAQLPNNSRSSLETAGSVSTPKKGFRVVNPDDPDSQTSSNPYVYNPPPLPSVNGGSPFSSRLQPSYNYGLPEAYPTLQCRAQSTFSLAAPCQKVASRHSDRRRTKAYQSYGEYPATDSEDDDDIWAKPPTDLSDQGDTTQPASQLRGQSPAVSVIGAREDWKEWFRPAPSAVYENLQDFFPGYDLDEAIVSISSADTSSEKQSQYRKKSIRVVAKDRAQSGPQRGTKLWDNKVEELHM